MRSTIGHECSHRLFHSDFYTDKNKKNYHMNVDLPEITGCKKTDIDGCQRHPLHELMGMAELVE